MTSSYLFRLDDACPTLRRTSWNRIEALFSEHDVRPLVAVIPDNQDKDLICDEPDPGFWDRAAAWQQAGWAIGLHGYRHVFDRRGAGLVPLNRHTEFAGHDLAEQTRRIDRGWRILREKGLRPAWWVAPAHTFDRRTLEALRDVTEIHRISDGLGIRPFRRFGFLWVPQQLWRPRDVRGFGRSMWTVCLHPNAMTDEDFEQLRLFLESGRTVLSWDDATIEAAASPWGVGEASFGTLFLTVRNLRQGLKAAARL